MKGVAITDWFGGCQGFQHARRGSDMLAGLATFLIVWRL